MTNPQFSLQLPDGWQMGGQPGGQTLIHDRATGVSLDICPTPLASPERTEGSERDRSHGVSSAATADPAAVLRQAQRELERHVARRMRVRLGRPARPVIGGRHIGCALEMLERRRSGAWWNIFRRPRIVLWRFWAVIHRGTMVVVSCHGQPEVLEKLRRDVDDIVASIHIADAPVLIGQPFTEAVLQLVHGQFPAAAATLVDSQTIRVAGQPVNLTGLHRRYLEEPNRLEEEVRQFFAGLLARPALAAASGKPGRMDAGASEHSGAQAGGAATEPRRANGDAAPLSPRKVTRQSIPGYNACKTEILPELRTDTPRLAGPFEAVQQEWINGLEIGYTLNGNTPITTEHLRRWNIDEDTLHEKSLENLAAKSHELSMDGNRAEGYTMLAFAETDRLNAVRVILPEFYRRLREHLGRTFYVAIPSRECLLAFSTQNEESLEWVRKQIRGGASKLSYPLTDKLFLVTPDGVAGDFVEKEPPM